MYSEEDFLQLAGIQHFVYCRRQWALIHVEGQWVENLHTAEGQIVHERTHDSTVKEKRGGLKIVRAMKIRSFELGISGECDVVEFRKSEEGVFIPKLSEKYSVTPVEYKKGKKKIGREDVLQLMAQAMCLEEMLVTQISHGYLFYHQTRNRQKVIFTDDLRNEVKKICQEMHNMIKNNHTPKVKIGKKCQQCSMKNICLPVINEKKSVKQYIAKRIL